MYFSPPTFIHLSRDYLPMFVPYTSFFPFLFFQMFNRMFEKMEFGVE